MRSKISGGGVNSNTAVPAEARGCKGLSTAQGVNMQKDWQAVQERELKALKESDDKLKATLRKLLYQLEFHADEYRDELAFSYEQRKLTPGVITRFEGIANDIKKALENYPQIEKAG